MSLQVDWDQLSYWTCGCDTPLSNIAQVQQLTGQIATSNMLQRGELLCAWARAVTLGEEVD